MAQSKQRRELLHLQVAAKLDELHHIESALARVGEEASWDAALVYQIQLVLEELAVNTANYGFGDDQASSGGVIELRIEESADTISIEYADNGAAFNPFEDAPKPDLDAELSDRHVGGLGVHFVRTLMDKVSYRRESERNHITLVKRRGE